MIKECLITKENRKDKQDLDIFFHQFLSERHGDNQETVAAWGYNMMDALRRYKYDADCELFLLILEKELALDVLMDQMYEHYQLHHIVKRNLYFH